MQKGDDAFRSIGEVASLIGVPPHVLRYWETQFTQLKPMKRPDGRRYYRPDDVRLAAGLRVLLRDDGLTIRGARKLIAADRGEAVRQRGLAHLGIASQIPAPEPAPQPDPAPQPEAMPMPRRSDSRADRSLPLFEGLTAPDPVTDPPPAAIAAQQPAAASLPQGEWLTCLVALHRALIQPGPAEARLGGAVALGRRLGLIPARPF